MSHARYVLDDQYTSSSGAKFPVKWCPPEVFNYSRFSSKSDVWSFGKTPTPLSLSSALKRRGGASFGNPYFSPATLPGVLMWEVFTEGRMPFEKNTNYEVVTMVTRGHRLHQPKLASKYVYEVMLRCWQEVKHLLCAFFLRLSSTQRPGQGRLQTYSLFLSFSFFFLAF